MVLAIIFLPISLTLFLFEKSISNFFITYVHEGDLKRLLIYQSKFELETFQTNRYIKSSKLLFFIIFFPILKFNLLYLLAVFTLTYFMYKQPYWKLKKEYKTNLALLRYQFPIWLRQIQILLHNNNVINSLILSQAQAPSIIKDDLEKLIAILNESPNNVVAFSEFMQHYKISEINRAMKLLYRCYIVNKNESAQQLNRMIASTTKWIRQERLERQDNNLSYFEWIGIIPLFGLTLVFMALMTILISNLFGKGVIL